MKEPVIDIDDEDVVEIKRPKIAPPHKIAPLLGPPHKIEPLLGPPHEIEPLLGPPHKIEPLFGQVFRLNDVVIDWRAPDKNNRVEWFRHLAHNVWRKYYAAVPWFRHHNYIYDAKDTIPMGDEIAIFAREKGGPPRTHVVIIRSVKNEQDEFSQVTRLLLMKMAGEAEAAPQVVRAWFRYGRDLRRDTKMSKFVDDVLYFCVAVNARSISQKWLSSTDDFIRFAHDTDLTKESTCKAIATMLRRIWGLGIRLNKVDMNKMLAFSITEQTIYSDFSTATIHNENDPSIPSREADTGNPVLYNAIRRCL